MTLVDRRYSVAEGTAVKAPCRVATTANITLSGTQTIDGVALVEHDRVLVKDQSTASQNGIYDVSTGNWTRARDFDGAYDIVTGTRVFVSAGTVSAGLEYYVSTTGTITIDTTSIAFTSIAAQAAASAAAAAASAASINQTLFYTAVVAAAETIHSTVLALRTCGNLTVGDHGDGIYKRVTAQPSHSGRFRSVDRYLPNGSVSASNGGWWELISERVTVAHFGGTMVLASAAHATATDQTTYANLAATFCRSTGAILHVPGGTKIRITTGLVNLVGVVLEGDGAQEETGGYGLNGSVILTDGSVNSAFLVGYGTIVRGVRFYDPGQLELNTTPLVRPTLFLGATGVGIEICFNFFTNAYSVLEMGATVGGRVKIHGNHGFIINRLVSVTNSADFLHIYDNVFNVGYFQEEALVGPTYALRNYAAANSTMVYAFNASGTAIDGLRIYNNFFFGISIVLNVASGSLAVGKIQGNLFDGTQTIVQARGSDVLDLTVDNNEIFGYRYGDRSAAAYIVDINTTGIGDFIMRKNFIHNSDGHGIKVYGTLLSEVTICENDILSWGSTTGADVTRYAIEYNIGGLAFIKNNNLVVSSSTAPSSVGICQTSATQGFIIGNSVYGTGSDAFQLVAGGGLYDGNTSIGCTFDLRVTGGVVSLGSNYFDPAKYTRSGGTGTLFNVLTP